MTDVPERILAWTVNEWGTAWNVSPEDAAPNAVEYVRKAISDAKDARIAELEAAIKRQAGAARTLRNLTLAEVQHIKDSERKEYLASKTLDSERDANAILTEENEALQARAEAAEAKLAVAVDERDRLDGNRKALESHIADLA